MRVDYCDCHSNKPFPKPRHIKRLEIGGGAGVHLCQEGWKKEMLWRMDRNQELAPENRFDILPWETAPELEEE